MLCRDLRIVPVFGPDSLDATPRLDIFTSLSTMRQWQWADASGEFLVIVDLPARPHKVQVMLANANRQLLDQAIVEFVIPEKRAR